MAIKVLKGRFRFSSPTILTLGNLDGVHLGHQKIIRKVVERSTALGLPSVVYTFYPHPLKIVAPRKRPPLITSDDEKAALLGDMGVDYMVMARFTKEFAARHPEEFVEDVLVRHMKASEVWVGHDYAFGRGKTGTVEYLKELGAKYGFKVKVMAAYKKGGMIVSSSLVRRFIQEGDVEKAANFLGRPYSIKGKVIEGDGRGVTLGFPTANMATSSELIPKKGVYVVLVTIGGKTYGGVANIGSVPTFRGKTSRVEVHIIDFKRSIYGRELSIGFIKRLRDERRFGAPGALVKQIMRDVDKARRILR